MPVALCAPSRRLSSTLLLAGALALPGLGRAQAPAPVSAADAPIRIGIIFPLTSGSSV